MENMLKGTWDLLSWSSSCCSKGTQLCSHNTPEVHTGTSCSTSDRKTCRACGIGSDRISSCIVMGILVISHSKTDKPVKLINKHYQLITVTNGHYFFFTHPSQTLQQKSSFYGSNFDQSRSKIDWNTVVIII